MPLTDPPVPYQRGFCALCTLHHPQGAPLASSHVSPRISLSCALTNRWITTWLRAMRQEGSTSRIVGEWIAYLTNHPLPQPPAKK